MVENTALDARPKPATPSVPPIISAEKKALFDSIAQDSQDNSDESQSSALKTFFAGLLWFGYAVAILVALALVWSAVNGLLKTVPR